MSNRRENSFSEGNRATSRSSRRVAVNGTAVEDLVATTFQYDSGPLNVTLASHWIGSTMNFGQVDHLYFGGPEVVLAIPTIGSENYLDLSLGYEFSEKVTARLAVANLLDQPPL